MDVDAEISNVLECARTLSQTDEDDDGLFAEDGPLELTRSDVPPKLVVYMTKSLWAYDVLGEDWLAKDVALFVRGPVPPDWCAELVFEHADRTGLPIRYIGDLSPAGILPFLSLVRYGRRRELDSCQVSSVEFVGVHDTWLELWRQGANEDFSGARPEQLPLTRFERLCVAKLETLKWLPNIIGRRAWELLVAGLKVELEALAVASSAAEVREFFVSAAMNVAKTKTV